MITLQRRGRLGNNLFQNCVASILSRKFNLKVEAYLHERELSLLNPRFHKGGISLSDRLEVSDGDLLRILKEDQIHTGLELKGFFQIKRFVLDYRDELLSNFDLEYGEGHQDDLFVHVRLGDTVEKKRNPGIDYYSKAIEQTSFRAGYISSDTFSHETVTTLIKKYHLIPYDRPRVDTVNFGKDFKNIVLSGGTFSWWIGFLSRAKRIFYPVGGPKWHGDIFVYNNWTPIAIDGERKG